MRTYLAVPMVLACVAAAGCNQAETPAAGAPAGGRGNAPAASVGIVTLAEKPIELTSDFISTVRSLHSNTVQPQVEGRVTKIYVKSGDIVRAGTPMLQIDPDKQSQTVRSLESQRSGREADVAYWKGQVERLGALVKAGAISKNEFDTAQHSYETAQSNLATLDAQVREARVQLQYYRVTAPASGAIGDITIREGDRVTTSTEITTIDDRAGLEAYIQVPIDRAPELHVGLPVRILDAEDKVIATNTITFVAPRADPETQTVLAKSLLRNAPPSVKVQQFLKTRVVWRAIPGLTVPITAVTRVSGQYFCFVAEPGANGLVARQRPLQVGEVLGNDYVVRGGLKPGDKLIVSGIQKIGDGAPVKPE